jgi:nitrite reductase (NADH) small subunit
MQTLTTHTPVTHWTPVCALQDIYPNTGVCALINGEQVAIFRVGEAVYALSNYDPFSKAYVLARGLVGDRNGTLKVASPIYKQNFSLTTGQCLDDEQVSVPVYPVQVVEGEVQVGWN